MPVDREGYCLFHSTNKNWKAKNGFTEKFNELIGVTTAISKNPNPPKWAFNFSGFYFLQDSEPLTIRNCEIANLLDFSFCQFPEGIEDLPSIKIKLESESARKDFINRIFDESPLRYWFINWFSARE